MTPKERMKEISDAEWRDKYIYGRKEKSSGELTPEERVGEIKAQAISNKNGFNYQNISGKNAQTTKNSGSVEFWRDGCPNCGGGLPVPENRETVKCMYCGSDVILNDLHKAVNTKAKLDYRAEKSNMIDIMGWSGLLSAFFALFAFPGLILTLPFLIFSIITYGYFEFAEKSKFASIAYLVFVALGR